MERSDRIDSLKAVIQALDAAAGKAGVKGIRIIICGGLAAIAYVIALITSYTDF